MFKKILFITITLLAVMSVVFAGSESIFPSACSGSTACTVANFSTNTTATIGHYVAAGGTGSIDSWDDVNFGTSQVYDDVTLRFYHGGEVGIDGSWTITFRSEDGLTTYCTTTIAHTSTDTYLEQNITTLDGCTWTTAELNDLEMTYANGDSMGPDDSWVYYAEIVVTGSNSCDYTSGNYFIECADSCQVSVNAALSGNNVTFNGSGIITLNANISDWTKARVQNGCQVQTSGVNGLKWN